MKLARKFLLTDLLYLKVFIAFGLGVFVSDFFEGARWLIILPLVLFIILGFTYRLLRIARSKWTDSAVFTILFAFSILLHSLHFYHRDRSLQQIAQFQDKEAVHWLRIEDQPVYKPNSVQIEATLFRSSIDTLSGSLRQKILIYAPKGLALSAPFYGQIVRIKGRLVKPPTAHYDFEFDYAQWLMRKQIYATIYTRDLKTIGKDERWLYQCSKWPLKVRDYFEAEIDSTILDPSENAIAKSILIGIKRDLDRDLYNAYADTGTVHILSISGLHFGILILFLEFLLSFIIKNDIARYTFKHLISFFYALITGFSAPIIRSFIMFLFFDIAMWRQWRISSYNVLFLAAWLILLYDTQQLFNIGYQFSFIALLGIMLIYQRAIWKVQFDNYVSTFLWKSLITLFAAWVFTTPLTIFYYHKFSWLGSLSNLFVVPLTTLIMYVGFIFLLVSKIFLISKWTGFALSQLIALQNKIILFFSELPYAYVSTNSLDAKGLLLLFICIAFILLFLNQKKVTYLRMAILFLCTFVLYSSFYSYQLSQKEAWFLNSNYRHTAIVYKRNDKMYVFADSIDSNMRSFFLKNISLYYHSNIYYYKAGYYFKNIPNKYSMNLEAKPQYLVLGKENKARWDNYIEKRDSFVLMKNVGFQKNNLIDTLSRRKKSFYVF